MTRKFIAAVLAVAVAVSSCSDSTGPSDAAILILGDGGSETAIETELVAAGHTVTQGGFFSDYAGTDFSAYDLVIVLNGLDYGYDMQPGVEQALLDYVNAGGTMLTTEWMAYDGTQALIVAALPLAYEDDYCSIADCSETQTKNANHPITSGLPATFDTPADWSYSYMSENAASTSTNVTVLLTGETGGASLAIGTRGTGRMIHWSMGGEYNGPAIWTTETKRILTNIAAFAASR